MSENQMTQEQQQAMEQQRLIMIQQQKQQQRYMLCNQIFGAMNLISAYNVLKQSAMYGITNFNLDMNSRNILSQKIYALFFSNGSVKTEEEWTLFYRTVMQAYQATMNKMVFNTQQMGMMGQPMMQQPMMGMNCGMPMGGMMGQPMMQQPMMGMGMPMNGMQMGMGMPMGGVGYGYGMQQPMMYAQQQPAANANGQPVDESEARINSMRAFVNQNIFNVDPIIFINLLMNNGVEPDDEELGRILGQALAQASYYMDDNTFTYFYNIVSCLYNAALQQQAKENGGNGNAQFYNQQMGMGMGMNCGMPMGGMGYGMQQPMGMMGQPMGMGMNCGMPMNGMPMNGMMGYGMQQPMGMGMNYGMPMGGMQMGYGMQQQMPGMDGGSSNPNDPKRTLF